MSVLERSDIHIAFERVLHGGLTALGDEQIDGLGAHELDVGAGGVEVRIVGNDVALLAGDAKEDALGGTSLMGGDYVLVAADVLDGIAKTIEAAASGIAFVAFHDGGPLVGGHGAGAGVGEQVDEDIVGVEEKQVVVRGGEQFLAMFARSPANRLDTLDAKWLDDGLDRHARLPDLISTKNSDTPTILAGSARLTAHETA